MGKGICIKIEKKYVRNNLYFYLVSRFYFTSQSDERKSDFYMAIDVANNRLLYFLLNDLKNPIKIIDFNNPNQDTDFPIEIDRTAALKALVKGHDAINQSNFPDRLDYCA